MANRENYDNLDPDITDEEMGKLSDLRDDTDIERAHDMATEEMYDTQHGDGHTFNPDIAMRDGLTYTPPDEEPIPPEELDEERDLPLDIEREPDPGAGLLDEDEGNDDVEIQDRIYRALRASEATAPHVDALTVQLHNGHALLRGEIADEHARARIEEIVGSIAGVERVESRLR